MTSPTINGVSSTPEPCCFLHRLPSELRNNVYGYAFRNTIIYPKVKKISNRLKAHETILALARTCRQIRSEVLPIYFGSNMFSFNSGRKMFQLIEGIGNGNKTELRQLQFGWDRDLVTQQFLLLRACPKVQRLWTKARRSAPKRNRKIDETTGREPVMESEMNRQFETAQAEGRLISHKWFTRYDEIFER